MALKTNKVNWVFLINGRVFLKKLGLMLVFHMMIFNWLGKKTYLLFGCWTLLCTLGNRNYIWTMNMHSRSKEWMAYYIITDFLQFWFLKSKFFFFKESLFNGISLYFGNTMKDSSSKSKSELQNQCSKTRVIQTILFFLRIKNNSLVHFLLELFFDNFSEV